jgi:hypothetical protein
LSRTSTRMSVTPVTRTSRAVRSEYLSARRCNCLMTGRASSPASGTSKWARNVQ